MAVILYLNLLLAAVYCIGISLLLFSHSLSYSFTLQVWPAVREHAAKTAVIVMAVILSLHFLLATGFMLYFFHASVSLVWLLDTGQ